MRTLAHLSDLHLGERPENVEAARALVRSVLDEAIDHVVVTGDVTHAGTIAEYELWLEVFRPLLEARRLTVVPGNHDRAGDGVAELLSDELRVSVDAREGLFMVCIDSTAQHNRVAFRSHGALCAQVLASIDQALGLAPAGSTVVLLLHHHVLPQPVEGLGEWFAERMGWPHAAELALGAELLRRAHGRADLVLHGHRHVPRETVVEGARPLRVANAGSSTALGAYRVFAHARDTVAAGRWVHSTGARHTSWWTRLAQVLPGAEAATGTSR